MEQLHRGELVTTLQVGLRLCPGMLCPALCAAAVDSYARYAKTRDQCIPSISSQPASARSAKLSSIQTAPPPFSPAQNARDWPQGASICTWLTVSSLERSERPFLESLPMTWLLCQSKSYQKIKTCCDGKCDHQ